MNDVDWENVHYEIKGNYQVSLLISLRGILFFPFGTHCFFFFSHFFFFFCSLFVVAEESRFFFSFFFPFF